MGGDRCFQKVLWERQVAPNMSDTEGPQGFIPLPALKVRAVSEASMHVKG